MPQLGWHKYTRGLASIGEDLSTYAFGVLAEGATPVTGLDHFTITNLSGFAIDVTISGTDMLGGTTWTLDDNATPGLNTYGLKAGLDGGDYTIKVKKTAPYNVLKAALGAGATQKWGLKMYAPTGMTDPTAKSGTVTVTAVAS
jgi:hypothetical protein